MADDGTLTPLRVPLRILWLMLRETFMHPRCTSIIYRDGTVVRY